MGVKAGPRVSTNGLVFDIDAAIQEVIVGLVSQ